MGMIDKKIKDDIGILILNNPPQNYLLKPDFIQIDELQEWVERNQLKALIISGFGRHFSGGAKLESIFSMAEASDPIEEQMTKGKEVLNYLNGLNIPVIAAISGVCFGGGLEIALSCHIRICSAKALFAFPETNLGLIPGLGGTVRLSNQISSFDSLKVILGGDMINAEEALFMKVVDKIVEEEDPLLYALHLLHKITDGRSLTIINYVMQSLKNAKQLPLEESMREETRMFCDLARIESNRRKNANQG
jgi:enoyl-CoA hydratase